MLPANSGQSHVMYHLAHTHPRTRPIQDSKRRGRQEFETCPVSSCHRIAHFMQPVHASRDRLLSIGTVARDSVGLYLYFEKNVRGLRQGKKLVNVLHEWRVLHLFPI